MEAKITQILQAGTVNTLALGAPKALIVIQTPGQPITGVSVNWLSYIGAASWGPDNVPLVVGGNDEQVLNFGPATVRKYDIGTATQVAVQQSCSQFLNVRVTDGTDLAATGTFGQSETYETVTVGGSIANGDSGVLSIIPNGGTLTTLTIPIVTADTTTTVAAKIAAAVNANAYLVSQGLIANNTSGVANIHFPSGGTFSRTNGSSITFTLGTTTATVTDITLTGYFTGIVGNGLVPLIGPGTAANSTKAILQRPGYVSEVFDNILGTGNVLWTNMASAINNGISGIRGPSQLCTAAAGLGVTGCPLTQQTVTMAGGTDGASGVTDQTLVGTDTAPRTGLYSLRASLAGVICPVDHSTGSNWTTFGAFGQGEGMYVISSTALGDTLTGAATDLSAAGVDNYGVSVFFGDWVYWYDQTNQVQRLLAPATFAAAMRALFSPEQSILNKQISGIIGTQKTLANGQWSDADKNSLYAYRLDLICNNPPGGSYWACAMGLNTSSNAAINGDNYSMLTNFIARSLQSWAGVNVGMLQTPDQRKEAKALIDQFFANMWDEGMIGNADSAFGVGTPPWSTEIDDTTTPPAMAALGYEIAAVRVQYLAVIRWFIINLMGGQTVTVVSETPPSFAQQIGAL